MFLFDQQIIYAVSLNSYKHLVSTQADTLERVKVENSQLKHQLGDTQHKVVLAYNVKYVICKDIYM